MAATIKIDVLSSTQLGVFVHFDPGDQTATLTCFEANIYCRLLREAFTNYLCLGLPSSEKSNLAKQMIGLNQGIIIPSASIDRRVPDESGIRPANFTTYAPADVAADTITINLVENPNAPAPSNATISDVCNNTQNYAIQIQYALPAAAADPVNKYFILSYPDISGLFSYIP